MDSLKALVAEKRKAIQDDSTRPTKYMRRGELERMKEEQEAKAREEKRLAEEAKKREEEAKEAERAAKKVGSCIYSITKVLMPCWRAGCTKIIHAAP